MCVSLFTSIHLKKILTFLPQSETPIANSSQKRTDFLKKILKVYVEALARTSKDISASSLFLITTLIYLISVNTSLLLLVGRSALLGHVQRTAGPVDMHRFFAKTTPAVSN